MPSIAHVSTPPDGLGTSIQVNVCGLVHWNSLMVPVSVTIFVLSNMVKE